MNFSIIEIAVKISAVMAIAAGAAVLMRRRASASSRHLLWTLAVIAVLMLPIASIVLPSLAIPIAGTSSAPVTTIAVAPESSLSGSIQNPANVENSANPLNFAVLYAAGVVFLLGRLALEQWTTRSFRARRRSTMTAGRRC
jgi:hypothetical protein